MNVGYARVSTFDQNLVVSLSIRDEQAHPNQRFTALQRSWWGNSRPMLSPAKVFSHAILRMLVRKIVEVTQ
jgi:hypothetical protein